MRLWSLAVVIAVAIPPAGPAGAARMAGAAPMVARPASAQAAPATALDRILDTYVRDGLVYYRALKAERGPLDAYVASLDVAPATVEAWSTPQQVAFWINAYNALVLRTVVDAYPIRGTTPDYPADSIRQVPGAFDRVAHRVAGRRLTLDQIETDVLAGFGDARVVLALGRGAIGSARLRSEAYTAAKLETQLGDAVRECATHQACVAIDEAAGQVTVTPLVSWRESLFVRTFQMDDSARWNQRSPIERAVIAMILPHLFQGEQAFLARDTFRLRFGDFDWRLNDLTGRGRGGADPRRPAAR
ncbi:MAG: DUF547 domain-containing protein [Vicinamibacterales bacterium]